MGKTHKIQLNIKDLVSAMWKCPRRIKWIGKETERSITYAGANRKVSMTNKSLDKLTDCWKEPVLRTV